MTRYLTIRSLPRQFGIRAFRTYRIAFMSALCFATVAIQAAPVGGAADTPTSTQHAPTYHVEKGPHALQWETQHAHIRCLFAPSHETPILYARLFFDVGSSHDGDLSGLARLTASQLFKGTADYSAEEVDERLTAVGASVNVDTTQDFTVITLASLTEEKALNSALHTFLWSIGHPSFPQAEIDRSQRLLNEAFQGRRDDQPVLVRHETIGAVFGANDPYASYPDGNTETIANIQRQDIRAFYEQNLGAKNATILLAGDLTLDQAQRLSERIAQALPAGRPAPVLPAIKPQPGSTHVVPANTLQSTIMLAAPLQISSNDPDRDALILSNMIFGGLPLNSELYREVREKHGFVYHIGSGLTFLERGSMWTIYTQTSNNQRAATIDLVKKVSHRYFSSRPNTDDLERARNSRLVDLATAFASNGEALQSLTGIVFMGLPLDHFEQSYKTTKAVTADDIVRINHRLAPNFGVIVYTQPDPQKTHENQKKS